MSLYGTLEKQDADYTKQVDEKIIECDQLADVILKINSIFRHPAFHIKEGFSFT
jgi:hypothetical protein